MTRCVTVRFGLIVAEVILLFFTLALSWTKDILIEQVMLTDKFGSYIEELPVLRPVAEGELIQLSLRGITGKGSLRLTPDDCFEQVSKNGTRIYIGCGSVSVEVSERPIRLDLLIRNSHGGPSGLHVSGMHRVEPVAAASLIALAIHLTWLLARSLGTSLSGAAIGVVGIIVRLVYLSETDIFTRTYDIIQRGGHLDYIRHIAQFWQRPNPFTGWEFHQPPPYYLLSALVYRLWHNSLPEFLELQLFSLTLSSLFLLLGIAIIEKLAPTKAIASGASFLFALFPSAIIHSVRLGNDLLVYSLVAASLYFLLTWEQEERDRFFFLSLVAAALACATKASGLPVMITCLLLAALRRQTLFAAISVVACGLVYGVMYFPSADRTADSASRKVESFMGASLGSLNPSLEAHPLLSAECLNPVPYLESAFLDTWDELTGSKCFAVSFLKSMLFGEFTVSILERWHLTFLLLGLGCFMWVGLLVSAPHLSRAIQLFVVTHLITQLAYYNTLLITPAADFRYVLPLLIPLSLGSAMALARVLPREHEVRRREP